MEKKNELRRLFDLLNSPQRRLPVIVLTQINRKKYPLRKFLFTVDDVALARDALGIAFVVCLPSELESQWSQMVGNTWTVTGWAVRVYWPSIDWEHDSTLQHPIAVPNKPGPWPEVDNLSWGYTDGENDPEFRSFLIKSVLIQDAIRIHD